RLEVPRARRRLRERRRRPRGGLRIVALRPMVVDPRFAPQRTDLPWLRRRRLPRTAAPAARPPRTSTTPTPPSPSPSPSAPPPPTPAARPAASPAPAAAPTRVRSDARVRAGERHLLTVGEPTVTLTRLQSAIGTLTVEAAVGPTVGDLRIGCAYDLVSGASSTVQLTQGNRLAPRGSRRPLLVAA